MKVRYRMKTAEVTATAEQDINSPKDYKHFTESGTTLKGIETITVTASDENLQSEIDVSRIGKQKAGVLVSGYSLTFTLTKMTQFRFKYVSDANGINFESAIILLLKPVDNHGHYSGRSRPCAG